MPVLFIRRWSVSKKKSLADHRQHLRACQRRWENYMHRHPQSPHYQAAWSQQQCWHCRYFIPLTGAFSEHYGLCSHLTSLFDGLVRAGNDGCNQHEEAQERWTKQHQIAAIRDRRTIYECASLAVNRDHLHQCHARWLESRYSEQRPELAGAIYEGKQCLTCRYYIPASGLFGADWGACSHPNSFCDSTARFEHDGCEQYEQNES